MYKKSKTIVEQAELSVPESEEMIFMPEYLCPKRRKEVKSAGNRNGLFQRIKPKKEQGSDDFPIALATGQSTLYSSLGYRQDEYLVVVCMLFIVGKFGPNQ